MMKVSNFVIILFAIWILILFYIAFPAVVYGQTSESIEETLQDAKELIQKQEGLNPPTSTETPPPLSLDSFLSPLENQWVNATYDAYNHLQEFEAFQEVCDQYNKLKVESEVRGCLEVYNSFNNYMDQLRTNHSETINKNLNISLQLS